MSFVILLQKSRQGISIIFRASQSVCKLVQGKPESPNFELFKQRVDKFVFVENQQIIHLFADTNVFDRDLKLVGYS